MIQNDTKMILKTAENARFWILNFCTFFPKSKKENGFWTFLEMSRNRIWKKILENPVLKNTLLP
jgi:hypothetical protein